MSEQLAEEVPVTDEAVVKEDLTTETAEDAQAEGEVKQDEPVEQAEDEVVITLGEDSPPTDEEENQAHDSGLLNKLRKQLRQTEREKKRLQQELQEKTQPKEAKLTVRKEPKLEDFDYDEDKYREDLLAWKEESDRVKTEAEKIKQEEQSNVQAFQNRVNAYQEAKAKFKGIDFEEAEAVIQEILSPTQIGIIIDCAKNPEQVIAALGKHTAKTKELAAITNPARYAAAIGALETQLKVTAKKSPPPPESTVSKGSGRISGAVDSALENLRKSAQQSGNYTEVLKYRMAKRKK